MRETESIGDPVTGAEFDRPRINAADLAPFGMVQIDLNGHVEYANAAASEIAGCSADALGSWLAAWFEGADSSGSASDWPRRFAERTPAECDEVRPVTDRDGDVRHVRVRASLARANPTDAAHVIVLLEEAMPRPMEDRELRESRDLYQGIVEMAAQGIWMVDAESRVTFVNERMASALGYEQEAMLGRPIFDFMDEEGREFASGSVDRGLDQFAPHEFKLLRSDGQEHWTLASIQPVLDADGQYIGMLGMFTDITDRRRAEEERARLAAIVESSSDAIVAETTAGAVLSWNKGAEMLYGYTAAEILGHSAATLVPEERIDEPALIRARLMRGERVEQYETVHLRKDGTRVAVALTVSQVFDRYGRPIGMASIARDISLQQQLRERLMFTDRMASLGTLASGVAHEINNPLTFVKSNLDFAVGAVTRVLEAPGGTADDDGVATQLREVVEALNDARVGADRVRNIVRDLKTFSRADDRDRGAVQVQRVIESTLNMAWSEIRHRARLVKDFHEVPSVDANESRLGQVFLNLIINAAHAIPEGLVQRNEIRVVTRTDAEGRAVVEISDTGVGIPRENIARLFDPFFTTKPVGVGTGLGLSICHGIVASLGGEIQVESEVGAGSTFRVVLPAARLAAVVRNRASQPPLSGPRCRVLCIDDEPMVLVVLKRMLDAEHTVTTAVSGGDAIRVIQSGERFDAIISDLMMPETSGMELHDRLLTIAPDQAARMVFLTGGAFTPYAREFLDRVPNARLEKPFDVKTLRALIRRLVTGGQVVQAND